MISLACIALTVCTLLGGAVGSPILISNRCSLVHVWFQDLNGATSPHYISGYYTKTSFITNGRPVYHDRFGNVLHSQRYYSRDYWVVNKNRVVTSGKYMTVAQSSALEIENADGYTWNSGLKTLKLRVECVKFDPTARCLAPPQAACVQPMDTVIAVDFSGSVDGVELHQQWCAAMRLAARVTSANGNDTVPSRVSLVAYTGYAKRLLAWTTDGSTLEQQAGGPFRLTSLYTFRGITRYINTNTATGLGEALYASLYLVQYRMTGRESVPKGVVLFTDGTYNFGRPAGDAAALLGRLKAKVYVAAVGIKATYYTSGSKPITTSKLVRTVDKFSDYMTEEFSDFIIRETCGLHPISCSKLRLTCQSYGDPRFYNVLGHYYTFQGIGTYELLRAPIATTSNPQATFSVTATHVKVPSRQVGRMSSLSANGEVVVSLEGYPSLQFMSGHDGKVFDVTNNRVYDLKSSAGGNGGTIGGATVSRLSQRGFFTGSSWRVSYGAVVNSPTVSVQFSPWRNGPIPHHLKIRIDYVPACVNSTFYAAAGVEHTSAAWFAAVGGSGLCISPDGSNVKPIVTSTPVPEVDPTITPVPVAGKPCTCSNFDAGATRDGCQQDTAAMGLVEPDCLEEPAPPPVVPSVPLPCNGSCVSPFFCDGVECRCPHGYSGALCDIVNMPPPPPLPETKTVVPEPPCEVLVVSKPNQIVEIYGNREQLSAGAIAEWSGYFRPQSTDMNGRTVWADRFGMILYWKSGAWVMSRGREGLNLLTQHDAANASVVLGGYDAPASGTRWTYYKGNAAYTSFTVNFACGEDDPSDYQNACVAPAITLPCSAPVDVCIMVDSSWSIDGFEMADEFCLLKQLMHRIAPGNGTLNRVSVVNFGETATLVSSWTSDAPSQWKAGGPLARHIYSPDITDKWSNDSCWDAHGRMGYCASGTTCPSKSIPSPIDATMAQCPSSTTTCCVSDAVGFNRHRVGGWTRIDRALAICNSMFENLPRSAVKEDRERIAVLLTDGIPSVPGIWVGPRNSIIAQDATIVVLSVNDTTDNQVMQQQHTIYPTIASSSRDIYSADTFRELRSADFLKSVTPRLCPKPCTDMCLSCQAFGDPHFINVFGHSFNHMGSGYYNLFTANVSTPDYPGYSDSAVLSVNIWTSAIVSSGFNSTLNHTDLSAISMADVTLGELAQVTFLANESDVIYINGNPQSVNTYTQVVELFDKGVHFATVTPRQDPVRLSIRFGTVGPAIDVTYSFAFGFPVLNIELEAAALCHGKLLDTKKQHNSTEWIDTLGGEGLCFASKSADVVETAEYPPFELPTIVYVDRSNAPESHCDCSAQGLTGFALKSCQHDVLALNLARDECPEAPRQISCRRPQVSNPPCPQGCGSFGYCDGDICVCDRGYSGPTCSVYEPDCEPEVVNATNQVPVARYVPVANVTHIFTPAFNNTPVAEYVPIAKYVPAYNYTKIDWIVPVAKEVLVPIGINVTVWHNKTNYVPVGVPVEVPIAKPVPFAYPVVKEVPEAKLVPVAHYVDVPRGVPLWVPVANISIPEYRVPVWNQVPIANYVDVPKEKEVPVAFIVPVENVTHVIVPVERIVNKTVTIFREHPVGVPWKVPVAHPIGVPVVVYVPACNCTVPAPVGPVTITPEPPVPVPVKPPTVTPEPPVPVPVKPPTVTPEPPVPVPVKPPTVTPEPPVPVPVPVPVKPPTVTPEPPVPERDPCVSTRTPCVSTGPTTTDKSPTNNKPDSWNDGGSLDCANVNGTDIKSSDPACFTAARYYEKLVLKSGLFDDAWTCVAPGMEICTKSGKDISHMIYCCGKGVNCSLDAPATACAPPPPPPPPPTETPVTLASVSLTLCCSSCDALAKRATSTCTCAEATASYFKKNPKVDPKTVEISCAPPTCSSTCSAAAGLAKRSSTGVTQDLQRLGFAQADAFASVTLRVSTTNSSAATMLSSTISAICSTLSSTDVVGCGSNDTATASSGTISNSYGSCGTVCPTTHSAATLAGGVTATCIDATCAARSSRAGIVVHGCALGDTSCCSTAFSTASCIFGVSLTTCACGGVTIACPACQTSTAPAPAPSSSSSPLVAVIAMLIVILVLVAIIIALAVLLFKARRANSPKSSRKDNYKVNGHDSDCSSHVQVVPGCDEDYQVSPDRGSQSGCGPIQPVSHGSEAILFMEDESPDTVDFKNAKGMQSATLQLNKEQKQRLEAVLEQLPPARRNEIVSGLQEMDANEDAEEGNTGSAASFVGSAADSQA